MFRDSHGPQPHDHDDQVWPVLDRSAPQPAPVIAPVEPHGGFRPAAAAPDVPAAVGVLLFGVYLTLVGALAIATAGPGESKFALAIAALFVIAFFTVPRLLFAQEQDDGRRTSMAHFLAAGLDTYTGHCSGRAALVQMFVVPVLLIAGILMIAMVVAQSA